MKLTVEQDGKCWNDVFIALNKGLNKGYEWNTALAMLAKYYDSKKSGAPAPNNIIFDHCIEICKQIMV